MRTLSPDQRRHIIWRRHHLGSPVVDAGAATAVARSLVGVHATDPASVFLGIGARTDGLAPEDIEREMFDERALMRILAMRRTLFVAPVEHVPTLHAASSWALAGAERRRSLKLIEMAGVTDDPAAWFDRVAGETVEALRVLGEATAAELTAEVADLGVRVEVNQGKKWAGKIGMSTRILFWLSVRGQIVRARPRGTWRSTLYRWAPAETWLPEALPPEPADPAAARADLARHYLRAFGPATFDDVHWWTGWNKTQTRAALESAKAVEVDLGEGTPGLLPGDDADASVDAELTGDVAGDVSDDASSGRVVLLPALDTTTMGWKQRDWYLGDLAPRLFDRNGNAGPTVWNAGRIIGGWAQRETGEVVIRLLRDAGAEVEREALSEAERLAAWLGDVRVIPRFRTPLERELSA